MRQINKKIFKTSIMLALILSMMGSMTKVSAASKASKTIDGTLGKITGEIFGTKGTTGKYFESDAITTKKVPRLYADMDLKYYSTGKRITKASSGWETNSKLTASYVYMDRYKNALKNNKKDGFVGTKVTAYGCAEAIVKKAYTVYTSCTY